MKKYVVRVFIPIIYEVYTETKEQATQIVLKDFKRLRQKGEITVDPTLSTEPRIEVEEKEIV